MTELGEQLVPLELIDPPKRRARLSFDPEELGRLADDMAANGLLQAIGVIGPDAEGRYEIAFGDRRAEAAKLLRWPTIRARIFPPGTDPLLARVSENEQRAGLSPLEEALQIEELRQTGRPLAEIARIFRRSHAWVASRLDLLELPEDLALAVHQGRLTLGVAAELARVDYEPYRQDLVAEAVRTGVTQRTAALWAAHYAADRARIVTNHLTVEEIAQRRESWAIVVDCQGCRRPCAYEATRVMRFCTACAAEIERISQDLVAPPEATRTEAEPRGR